MSENNDKNLKFWLFLKLLKSCVIVGPIAGGIIFVIFVPPFIFHIIFYSYTLGLLPAIAFGSFFSYLCVYRNEDATVACCYTAILIFFIFFIFSIYAGHGGIFQIYPFCVFGAIGSTIYISRKRILNTTENVISKS